MMTDPGKITPAAAGNTQARASAVTRAMRLARRRTVMIPVILALVALEAAFGWAEPSVALGWSRPAGLDDRLAGAAIPVVVLAAAAVLTAMLVAPCLVARRARRTRARRAVIRAAELAGQPCSPPCPPLDMAGALQITGAILADLQPGPEWVTAADPAATQVRWDAVSWLTHERDLDLPEDRADKMQCVRFKVRTRADDVMHRLPQLLLVADDGAVIELFGGRTGAVQYGEMRVRDGAIETTAAGN